MLSSAKPTQANAIRRRTRFGVSGNNTRLRLAKIAPATGHAVDQALGEAKPGSSGNTAAVRAVDVIDNCAVTVLPLGFTELGAIPQVDPAGAPEQLSVTA
jgi:hypothetical protein